MAIKDYKKSYSGIRGAGSVVPVANAVSRDLSAGEKSFESVIWQSGKPILDSELEIHQDAIQSENRLFRSTQTPSGWIRSMTRNDGYQDYITVDGTGIVDSSGQGLIDGTTLVNSFAMPKMTALVAGRTVVVEFTNTETSSRNLIALEPPPYYAPDTIKRTDFVFLEVWLALVAPSPRASGAVQVASADAGLLDPGDTITINGVVLTATNVAPGLNEFLITVGDPEATAVAITTAINDPANSFATMVTARTNVDIVILESVVPGDGHAAPPPPTGNFITLAVASGGGLVRSGATFTGGDDRPNKPQDAQDMLFRHGNKLSPAVTWLPDEIVDPVVDIETSQRVQVQYRIRTVTHEAINYKTHPDGFSNSTAGSMGADEPIVLAQGARINVASDYPFVPADCVSTWLNSSAVAYGLGDNGLWIAGDGSTQSVKDLGSLDGYVYAIPICFIFRHSDVSSFPAAPKGFDPAHNSNGAPLHDHGGYDGPLGVIPAGHSDRPDGEFADVITLNSILDLRRSLMPTGIDLTSELQYQIQSLLDANNRTWAVDSHDKHGYSGGENGDVSTRFLVCNTIGRTGGSVPAGTFIRQFDHVARRFGSNPVVERVVFAFWPGDRAAGPAVAPGQVNPGKYVVKAGVVTDTWAEGDVLHLDLTQFDTATLGSVFQGGKCLTAGGPILFSNMAPPGTVISDVLSIYHDDGNYGSAVDQRVQATLIKGLGTQHVEIALDANDTLVTGGLPPGPSPYPMVDRVPSVGVASKRRIFVEVEVSYPIGDEDYHGLTDTPIVNLITPDATVYNGTFTNPIEPFLPGPGTAIVADLSQVPVDAYRRNPPGFREGFREVRLDYDTNATDDPLFPTTDPVNEAYDPMTNPLGGIVSRDRLNVMTPRRMYDVQGYPRVFDVPAGPLGKTVDFALTEYGSSSRKAVLDVGDPLSGLGQTLCNVEYYPQDPIPSYGYAGYTVLVYYRAAAPQTAGTMDGDITAEGSDGGTLPADLRLEPLAISPSAWTAQTGMGSVDAAFPYSAPMDQVPIMEGGPFFGGTPHVGEWYFCASATVTVDDFNADTGMLALHPMVQIDQQPEWTLGGTDPLTTPRRDAEFRALYPYVTGLGGYRPTMMAQPLFGSTRHKVFVPMLARVAETTKGTFGGILFRQDELVLVVLSRWAELDEDNNLRFVGGLLSEGASGIANALANRTCAAVYRTRNLLLTVAAAR